MISWTPDQRALRSGLADWLHVLNAEHVELDRRAEFPRAKWEAVRRVGLLGLPIGRQWGGLGQDLLTTMYVLEGLGEGCRDAGLNFSVSTHLVSTGVAVQQFGSAVLKDRYLSDVAAGTRIGAHAITEPDSGSDALAMRTRAVPAGDHFLLTGQKAFVSNGPVADLIMVYARTGEHGGPLSITAFLVERNTPGLEVGPPTAKMGLRTSPFGDIYLDNCRVPASNVVGAVGGGFLVLDHVMKWEILCGFAISVGEMRHRVDRCRDYARARSQFGAPIGKFQAVAHRIVDMEIGVRTARGALFDAASRMVAGANVTMDIAVAKVVASEANLASALAAVQIFGGNGYTTEYGVEKELRNAVAGTIYSGTSETQRNRIAAMLGL